MAFCYSFSAWFTQWGRNTHSHRGSRDTRRVKMCKCLEFPSIRQWTSAEPSLTTAKQTLVWPASLPWQVTKNTTNGCRESSVIPSLCSPVELNLLCVWRPQEDEMFFISPHPALLLCPLSVGVGRSERERQREKIWFLGYEKFVTNHCSGA